MSQLEGTNSVPRREDVHNNTVPDMNRGGGFNFFSSGVCVLSCNMTGVARESTQHRNILSDRRRQRRRTQHPSNSKKKIQKF